MKLFFKIENIYCIFKYFYQGCTFICKHILLEFFILTNQIFNNYF